MAIAPEPGMDPSDAKLAMQARAAANAKAAAKAAADKAAADKAALAEANASRAALTRLTSGATLTNEERKLLNMSPVTPPAPVVTKDPIVVDTKPKWTKAGVVVTANGPVDVDANGLAADGSRPVAVKAADVDKNNPPEVDIAALINSITAGFQAQIDALAKKPAAVTSLGQVTRRKPGGVVEVWSQLSDGTEKLIDQYTDFSARDSVMKMFENTGLEKKFMDSLLASIDNVYLENVAPTDAQILNSIYNSDAYKTRFAANEIIRKRMADGTGMAGDKILNPAEYIAVEEGYRTIMQNAGLPAGFYDNPNDFTNLIGNKIDTAELKARVNIAADALQKADQQTKDALRSYYGLSDQDMVAYLLDADKAFKIIEGRQAFTLSTADAEKQYGAAQIGGAALRAGQEASKGLSEEIYKADKGKEAEGAFQSAAQQQQAYERLVGLSGGQAGKEDLVRAQLALEGGAGIATKAKELASKERARFQQRSAIKKESLQRSGIKPDV